MYYSCSSVGQSTCPTTERSRVESLSQTKEAREGVLPLGYSLVRGRLIFGASRPAVTLPPTYRHGNSRVQSSGSDDFPPKVRNAVKCGKKR